MTETPDPKPPGWPIGCFDARVWAKEFTARFPQVPEDDVIGWFACSIMTGYDQKHADVEALLGALQAHDAYMSKHYSEGPTSSALHPDAAANWKRVRDAMVLWRKFSVSGNDA